MDAIARFQLLMIIQTLEHCFRGTYISYEEAKKNISEEDVKFYYREFIRLQLIRGVSA